MIENLWIRAGCFAVAISMAVTIFTGAEQAGQAHFFPPPWDKAVHFLYYGTMAFLMAHGVGRRWLWVPLILVPTIGALDEWHQQSVPGRDASFFDWLADEAGTVAFVYAYYRATRRGVKHSVHAQKSMP
jgi:VanZ family protein